MQHRRGKVMYRIGICDSQKAVCARMEEMILLYAKKRDVKLETEVWYTGESVCKYLEQRNNIDILFLDIELLHMTGIEVADFIRNQMENRKMQIVYISEKQSYALALFKTQPLDFLMKPIHLTQIEEVMDLGIKILFQNKSKFEYQYGKEYFYVKFDEIVYFVSEGRKIKIVTLNDEKHFYGRLRDVITTLPKNFIYIHQSYIVNKSYIVMYSYEHIEVIGGMQLPISKVHRSMVRNEILEKDG